MYPLRSTKLQCTCFLFPDLVLPSRAGAYVYTPPDSIAAMTRAVIKNYTNSKFLAPHIWNGHCPEINTNIYT